MNTAFYINISPVMFNLGPLSISWYGVMVALAVIAVVAWALCQNSKRQLFNNDTLYMAALVGIPSGIIFSKVLHIIDLWSVYIHEPGKIFSGEGLTIWGAVLGAAIGIWIYSHISKQFRFNLLGDILAPGIILAQAIGRVGCTLNGCCYGVETHSSIAIIYTNTPYAPSGIPVLPTQVFEIFYDLAVFGILLALRGKFKKEGTLFLFYLALYAVWRLGIDFFRDGTNFLFGLHQAQVIGIIILLFCIPFIIYRERKASPDSLPLAKED